MNSSDFTPEQKEQFEQELQETDATAILLGIHAELAQIRSLLENANTGESEASEEMYECDFCGERYPKNKIVGHATEQHKAPYDLSPDNVGTRI